MNRFLNTTCVLAVALLAQPVVAAGGLREQAAALFGSVDPVTPQELADPVVHLGRALFFEASLSADGRTACASCHAAADWGSDHRVRSPNARGELTKRHAQSVFNAQQAEAGLRWIADRASGAEQALGSVTGSMGLPSRAALIAHLHEHGYDERFRSAFPEDEDPMTAENYARALETYQRTLRTPAAFDRWLTGDDTALDERQLRGLRRFIDLGCAGCHSGPLFGGSSLQRFGVVEDFRPLPRQ